MRQLDSQWRRWRLPALLRGPRRWEVGLACLLAVLFFVSMLVESPSGRVERAVKAVGDDSDGYPVQSDEQELDLGKLGADDVQESAEERREDAQKELDVISEAMEKEMEQYDDSEVLPRGYKKVPALGNLLFSDGEAFEAAPYIKTPTEMLSDAQYGKWWYSQKLHEEFFMETKHKLYIPHLAQSITRKEFHEVFRQTSTPVVIPFQHMRKLGFITKAMTMEDLRREFPYEPPQSGVVPSVYHNRAGLDKTKKKLDLGPGVYAISQDTKLHKGTMRNYPRNMLMGPQALRMLNVSYPPFVPKKRFQLPTLWFGTSTSDTKLHHDCCDNWVSMIHGTKRWLIAPPTDARKLAPIICSGKHQSLCWASLKYPNQKNMSSRDMKILESLESITIDIKQGEMLYLPAGWFHHIENLGPTVMMNFWTRGCENVGLALDKDPLRPDRPDFDLCPRVARDTNDFISQA